MYYINLRFIYILTYIKNEKATLQTNKVDLGKKHAKMHKGPENKRKPYN